jgi:hypothetical protein
MPTVLLEAFLVHGHFEERMTRCPFHKYTASACERHARAGGNPGDERHRDWMPACAGMTFSWRRTYETDI